MSSSDSGDEIIDRKPVKKRVAKDEGDQKDASSSKKCKKSTREVDADGNEMFEIGNNRFLTVREFKGKALVDIREYYMKDGKRCPGKKGISLSREQFQALKGLVGEIEQKLVDI
ncbi:unnamed protein product [Bursaphelenchus xylophilus]|uniref:(pine wood nematode) hypothetical protein n=1 Tax=Bursaphelenchus xylophilus TaxID=6326 RepID=A0A1I7S3I9_BURXY|nr:unnamed protein product [Bursaphelenchus xylophilus]CAG9116340.1 unnamed protein product [Bursaphelenchus xylophilus]